MDTSCNDAFWLSWVNVCGCHMISLVWMQLTADVIRSSLLCFKLITLLAVVSGIFSTRWMTWSRTSQRNMKGLKTCQTPSTHLRALEWSLMRYNDSNAFHGLSQFEKGWLQNLDLNHITFGVLGQIYSPVAVCMSSSGWAASRAGEVGEESGWERLWDGQNGRAALLSQSVVHGITFPTW